MLPSSMEAGNIRNNHPELLATVVGVVFYRPLHFSQCISDVTLELDFKIEVINFYCHLPFPLGNK